jgi:hypothetical protein
MFRLMEPSSGDTLKIKEEQTVSWLNHPLLPTKVTYAVEVSRPSLHTALDFMMQTELYTQAT